MADRIEFGPVNRRKVGNITVYTRANWTDDWEFQPFLEVDEVTWSAAPSLPTATITWHYGLLARVVPGWGFVRRKDDLLRLYVRITAQLEFDDVTGLWTTKTWYGILDISEDQVEGTYYEPDGAGGFLLTPRGQQTLTAYGLERILQEEFRLHSYWAQGDDPAIKTIERGLEFNHRGLPNRHFEKRVGRWIFAGKRDEAEYWSTRQIVQYLMSWDLGDSAPGFALAPGHEAYLPDWDQPVVPTHSVRVYDLLEQLIPRQRMLGWYLDVDVPTNRIWLWIFTFTAAPIVIGEAGAKPIPANPQQYHLVPDKDRTAQVTVKDSDVAAYDQVVVNGARRRSVCTLAFADGTLDKGWTSALETQYEAGASGAADYPAAAEVKERQQRNQEARSSDHLRPVFRRFQVPEDWDLRAAAGLPAEELDPNLGAPPVFPQHDPQEPDVDAIAALPPFPVYRLELVILPTLPLLAGVDYSGDKLKFGTVDESAARRNREELPIFIAWKLPGEERYVSVDELGRNADLEKDTDAQQNRWSGDVRPLEFDAAIELNVHGAPQHVIAKTDFAPLDVDQTIGPLGDHDWREMLATVAILDDRYCQGLWPLALPPGLTRPRRLFLDAGDGYKQDYVAEHSVVAIDGTTGELVRSDGGYVRNDTALLIAGAKVAYEWYAQERRLLTLKSHYLLDFPLGSFITAVGDDVDPANVPVAINSPVTEIKLTWPRGTPDSTEPPSMTITTGAENLNPLRTLGEGGNPMQGAGPLRLARPAAVRKL